ncbi:hypothetical protein MFIFM68171_06281 [Madurella fahalii]|uniref:Uncharacterized protein n=1 Tax=Madurella fahalii TaxID=1157608 RepID=A0ABQ0GE84_9PEZI
MANTYDITILNESGASQSYLLFAVAPQVSGAGSVFSNIFMTAPPIVSRPDGSSSTTFTIARQFYGICGTSIENLAAGVKVATSDYEPVTLGSNAGTPVAGTTLNFTTTGGANFPEPLPTATAPTNAFTIQCDSSFRLPDPNNSFVGLGGMNMAGKVVPMATFTATPSTTFNIFPVVKYYIATGTYTPGQIINLQAIGVTQLVDFTNTTYSSVTYIHNNSGQYTLAGNVAAKAAKLARLRNEKVAALGADADDWATVFPVGGKGRKPKPHQPTGGSEYDDTVSEKLAKDLQSIFMKMLSAVETKAHKGQSNCQPPEQSVVNDIEY